MAKSNEIIELVRKRIRQLPKRTSQEEFLRQQEYIRDAGNAVFRTDLSDEEMAKLANTSTTSTGCDGGLTATQLMIQLRQAELYLPPAQPSVVGLRMMGALVGDACFGGLCQPHRPEVLRKTVHSRIVEPLALPAGKEGK